MRSSFAIILMTTFILAAAPPTKQEAGNDQEKLQGTWVLTSATVNGDDKTAEWVKLQYKAVIKGDKITLGGRGDMRTSPLALDPASKPKSFDFLISLGIYELKGDQLKVCLGGRKRPAEFASKADSQNVLFVFKRAKPTPEEGKKTARESDAGQAKPKQRLEVRDGPVPARNEIVMSSGMKITAKTPVGTISITAGKGLRRSYTWEGATRSVTMEPREQRWYGSLGIAYPGLGCHWKPHNGIARAVTEEGQQHFKTEAEALEWLRKQKKWLPLVYRNDGLVVGWTKYLPRKQLNVDVWQIYIAGKKPTKLPGGQDDKIKVELPKVERKGQKRTSHYRGPGDAAGWSGYNVA
jgi:uncharacterized protein (TIGR03067 family)